MAVDFIKNPTPMEKRLNSKPKGYDFWKPPKTEDEVYKEEAEKLAQDKADFAGLKAEVEKAEKDFQKTEGKKGRK